jgi:hypothetical protein
LILLELAATIFAAVCGLFLIGAAIFSVFGCLAGIWQGLREIFR